jgi:guanine deaminase
LRRALDKGLNIGLGTDISGGPSGSMLEACRATVAVSRQLDTGVDPKLAQDGRGVAGSRVDMRIAFHLATTGGGVALDLPIGLFRKGYQADAIVVDPAAADGSVRLFGADPLDHLEQILYTASLANLAQIHVSGERVA